MSFKIRFKVGMVSGILLIVFTMTIAALASVWLTSSRAAEQVAENIFGEVAGYAGERIDQLIGQALTIASQGAAQPPSTLQPGDGLNQPQLPFMRAALDGNPALYSLYYGYEDGGFLQMIATRGDNRVIKAHEAPIETRWIVRTITGTGDQRVQRWAFLDRRNQLLGRAEDPQPGYDPRKRPWYGTADGAKEARLSLAYIFNSLKEPGITASQRLPDGSGVFGADITIADLSGFVESQFISRQGGLVILDEKDRILAVSNQLADFRPLGQISESGSDALQALFRERDLLKGRALADGLHRMKQNDTPMIMRMDHWTGGGRGIDIAVIAPVADFMGPLAMMQKQIFVLSLLCLIIFVPMAYVLANRMSNSLRILTRDAEQVRQLDFSSREPMRTNIIEFHRLDRAHADMRATLSSRRQELQDAQNKLTRLIDMGIAMSVERNSEKLMEMVLLGAKELANADGGTLYIIDDEGRLQFQIVSNNSLNIAQGGTSGTPVNIPPVPLYDEDGNPNHNNVVSHAVHEEVTINITDAYADKDFDFSGTRAFDSRNGYRSQSFITVPLKPRGGEVIGALQLINARDPELDVVRAFTLEDQQFVEALAAQAATALYNRSLISAQEKLMDSMIQLVAGAIDIKSPYTGAHCERVPELAIMLAEAAGEEEKGPLAEFGFTTREEWREFRIGAWLHDCGKVVTPEYVVDKATKLETIYNRIHEIRMRFEVLLRDARIAMLERQAGGQPEAEAAAEFEAEKARLTDDFAFIAQCNLGGEFMEPDEIERLEKLAQTTWVRHFDNRLGLAHDELGRYTGDTESLPIAEPLLADRPEHVMTRDGGMHERYQGLGFKVDIPENLYNSGELHNLTVKRGTLTPEERFKINEHIMQTIVMLESMPFPKHLKRVPEYAGTHHETLTGSGYPRALTKDELSIPARIMAIADIFEALTASDRPYKKAKTLSESVRILSFFKKDGHIDPDLFDLFLTSGTYLKYAERHLGRDQIDTVDIEQYLG